MSKGELNRRQSQIYQFICDYTGEPRSPARSR